jgi:hypothetical protein
MPKKSELVRYVQEYLGQELRAVSSRTVELAQSILSLEEGALIYKYSEDGYEAVNSALRNSSGETQTQMGKFLDMTIRKLPDYRGLVYRCANLNPRQLQTYIDACEKNSILVEHTFISTSASYSVANMFGGNCKFEMISRSGKLIEKYAKYGTGSGQNEHEVLFRPNRKFRVLEVTKLIGHSLIVMEEI